MTETEIVETTPPADAQSAPPTLPADGDAATPDSAGQENVEQPETDDDKRRKRSVSERISTITAQRREAEARAAASEQRAMALERELQRLNSIRVDDLPYEDAERLRLQQVLKAERLEDHRSEAMRQAEEVGHATAAMFRAKVAAVADRMPTLMEDFSRVPISEHAAQLIAESDRAVEIAYYLSKNPGEAIEIDRSPPHVQGARIARIEAKVSAAPLRRASTAPSPIPTIAGSAPSVGSQDPATMSFADYRAMRQKQLSGGKR